jgi:DNA-binding NtrC family response regulator
MNQVAVDSILVVDDTPNAQVLVAMLSREGYRVRVVKPVEHEEVLARVRAHDDLRKLQLQLSEANQALEERLAERTTELKAAIDEVERLKEQLEHGNVQLHELPEVTSTKLTSTPSSSNGGSLHTLQEVERRHFMAVLTRTRGVIEGPNGAAKMLDLKPSTARFRIRKLGIKREDFVAR